MGMTGDYEVAIEEGATVGGQAIFGKRPTSDSHYRPTRTHSAESSGSETKAYR